MRHEYVDWLRNLAILFLFPYHTSRVFDGASPFYVQGPPNAFSTVLVQLSYWFMPLLFLLAGMSSLYALRRRDVRSYARERVLRLLVPLIAGFILVVPPQSYYARAFHHGDAPDYAAFLWRYFTDFSDWSEYGGGITLGHLWFILFLFVISTALLPVMTRLVESEVNVGTLRRPAGLLLLPPAALAGLSLLPDLAGKNPFVYAGYFFLGFLLATDDRAIEAAAAHRKVFLALALVGAAAIVVQDRTAVAPASSLLWHPFAHWAALLALLGYGKRHLRRRTPLLAYANRAAFPVYALHQTVLVAVGYHVLQFTDGAAGFVFIMVITLVLTLAVYEGLRRIGPTRFLFGIKTPKAPAAGGRTM